MSEIAGQRVNRYTDRFLLLYRTRRGIIQPMTDRRGLSAAQLAIGMALGCGVAVIPSVVALFAPSQWANANWHRPVLLLWMLCFLSGIGVWQGMGLFLRRGLRARRWEGNQLEPLRRRVSGPVLSYVVWLPLLAAVAAIILVPGHRMDRAIWLSFLFSPVSALWSVKIWLSSDATRLKGPFSAKPLRSDHWGEPRSPSDTLDL